MLRNRGRQGLPLNLDAWDGYPENRSRALQAFREYANNVVVLAGDTHSSWAFDLHADDNQIVAVEFGTPSVTSPGFENFLALPEGRLEEATMQASPELKYMRANGRGWVELNVQRDKVRATWHFVSTITDRSYELVSGATLETLAGNPAIRHV
ncbi:MAG: alkaline phosphatase D family protein [Gammaproteobacteria bacterium]|nr:alkaline phosphatase D family protein [Gammaproteobacteria bacterium]